MGLERHEEDFGQTLGVWGFNSGPYIMIPFLGPSNPRDLLSRPISSFLSGTFAMEDNDVKLTLIGIDVSRQENAFLTLKHLLSEISIFLLKMLMFNLENTKSIMVRLRMTNF